MASDTVLSVDDLAQEIRRVDGKHDLGAGALAEALMPFIEQAVLQSPEVKKLREDAERYRWLRDRNGNTESDVRVQVFIADEAWQAGHLDWQMDIYMEKQP